MYRTANPYTELARTAIMMNPKQFELPVEYQCDFMFPGSIKKPSSNLQNIDSVLSREARANLYSERRYQELERPDLPVILHTCFLCKIGTRKAPLIHCDYCPLVFHADCLDPPLTNPPSTRWMCPNHVEPTAEKKLLTSSSYYERVKLWTEFSKPIDQESVKAKFLEKVSECCRSQTLDDLNQQSSLNLKPTSDFHSSDQLSVTKTKLSDQAVSTILDGGSEINTPIDNRQSREDEAAELLLLLAQRGTIFESKQTNPNVFTSMISPKSHDKIETSLPCVELQHESRKDVEDDKVSMAVDVEDQAHFKVENPIQASVILNVEAVNGSENPTEESTNEDASDAIDPCPEMFNQRDASAKEHLIKMLSLHRINSLIKNKEVITNKRDQSKLSVLRISKGLNGIAKPLNKT